MNTDGVDVYFTCKNKNDEIYIRTQKGRIDIIYLILLNLYLSMHIMSNTIIISNK